MDVLGISPMKTQKQFKRSRRNKGVKVVYISSPMKVKTSASEFRALVQELTGRNSDAERFMEEINGVGINTANLDDQDQHQMMMKSGSVEGGSHESDHYNFNINSSSEYSSLPEYSPLPPFAGIWE
ncbi:hypothetical protein L484_023976 [Morus notabilis]|uniref:VQ domain-containing protein n=1 Tax=Morus notabilis TaxID=981085 RepID=W9RNW5_9ROSA|nr:uncharacterized protein LOC21406728 [Morus notabilis]EXB62680.1 hypothetical protein L484_023976 [Morus notabilis]